MKIILLKDVRGVGQHGEIKTVADGYAINRLFPAKLAEPATEEKIKQIEAEGQARAAARQEEERQLDTKVQSLRGKRVLIAARATEKGGLFKTLHESDIIRAIREEHSIEIPDSAICFIEPIKTVGEHTLLVESKSHKVELGVGITPAL